MKEAKLSINTYKEIAYKEIIGCIKNSKEMHCKNVLTWTLNF